MQAQHTPYRAGLTARQKQVYDFVREHITQHGICPSYDEISVATAMVKSQVSRVVDALVQRGLLVKIAHTRRSLALTQIPCPHCGKTYS